MTTTGADPAASASVKVRPSREWRAPRLLQHHVQQSIRAEPGVGCLQRRRRPDQDAGHDHEEHAPGHLRHHEGVAQAARPGRPLELAARRGHDIASGGL
jgi:hypothetical protein